MSAEIAASVATPAAAPAPEPELDGGVNSFADAPDDEGGGDFNVEDLRKQARAALRAGRKAYSDEEEDGGSGGGEEEEEPKAKALEKAPPKAKEKAVPKPQEDDGDPDAAEHRKKLETDGKLDDEKLSNSFAALRRKMREHDAAATKFESERQAYKAERETFQKEREAHQQWKEAAKRSPLVALKEAGWTWEQLTAYVANEGAIPPEKLIDETRAAATASESKLLKEVEELRSQNQKFQDQYHAQQYTARVTGEIKTGIDSGKYPLVAEYLKRGAFTFDHVVNQSLDNIARVWANEKKSLDVGTILAHYERELTEARKVHGSGATQAAEDPEAAKPVTNQATSERTRRPREDAGLWTEDDAIEARKQALAMLRGG